MIVLVNGLIGIMEGRVFYEVLIGAIKCLPPIQRRDRQSLRLILNQWSYVILHEYFVSRMCPAGDDYYLDAPLTGLLGVKIVKENELPTGADWELRLKEE
jgi:hypothetical protein